MTEKILGNKKLGMLEISMKWLEDKVSFPDCELTTQTWNIRRKERQNRETELGSHRNATKSACLSRLMIWSEFEPPELEPVKWSKEPVPQNCDLNLHAHYSVHKESTHPHTHTHHALIPTTTTINSIGDSIIKNWCWRLETQGVFYGLVLGSQLICFFVFDSKPWYK